QSSLGWSYRTSSEICYRGRLRRVDSIESVICEVSGRSGPVRNACEAKRDVVRECCCEAIWVRHAVDPPGGIRPHRGDPPRRVRDRLELAALTCWSCVAQHDPFANQVLEAGELSP